MVEKPKRQETTKTHKEEKERLETILKNQSSEHRRVTYTAVTKHLVDGEAFEHLFLDGVRTHYLKCLNPKCTRQGFIKQHFACKELRIQPAKVHCIKNHSSHYHNKKSEY